MVCRKDFCECSTHCEGQGCEEAEAAYRRRNNDNIPMNVDCFKCDSKDNCKGQACENAN